MTEHSTSSCPLLPSVLFSTDRLHPDEELLFSYQQSSLSLVSSVEYTHFVPLACFRLQYLLYHSPLAIDDEHIFLCNLS